MKPDLDVDNLVASLRAKQADPERLAEYEAAQERAEATRVHDVLKLFGVPRRIRETLDGVQQTRPLASVCEWLEAPDSAWCLVLSSGVGVGKSTAAGWWLSQVARDVEASPKIFRRWWPATEIAALDTFGEDYPRLAESQSLVIDDMGPEYVGGGGAVNAKMDRLIDGRYREYRRTLITTNLDPKGFAEKYGQRVFDRLREGGRWVSIAGQSMRRSA